MEIIECHIRGCFNPNCLEDGEVLPEHLFRNAEGLLLNSSQVVACVDMEILKVEIDHLKKHSLICRFFGSMPTGNNFSEWLKHVSFAAGGQ